MFPVTWVAPLGASGLVSLAVILIFTGRWIPASVLRRYVSRDLYEELRADRDLWRTLALENRHQLSEVLLPTAEAARKTFSAVDQITSGNNDT